MRHDRWTIYATHVFFHRLEYQALQLVQALIYPCTPPLLHDRLVALQLGNYFGYGTRSSRLLQISIVYRFENVICENLIVSSRRMRENESLKLMTI